MPFDFSASALVNAGGGFLFAALGLIVLWISFHSRRGRRLGILCIWFGLDFMLANLILPDDSSVAALAIALIVVDASTTAVALLLCLDVLQGTAHIARKTWGYVVSVSVFVGLTILAARAYYLPGGFSEVAWTPVLQFASETMFWMMHGALSLLLVSSAVAARSKTVPGGIEPQGLALLSLGFAAWLLFSGAQSMFPPGFPRPELVGVARVISLGVVGIGLVGVAAWFPVSSSPRRGLFRNVFLGLLGFSAVGALAIPFQSIAQNDLGGYGIVRTIGVFLLAAGVFRTNLLGATLPQFALRRGPLTAGALAILFITATIAQNFFAAKYGLLFGGVVAGTFLFAAQPLQRAIERRARDDSDERSSATEAYRAAVRAAIDDGVMTPSEETHLAAVAHHLQMSPLVALGLRREVEAERAKRRRVR